MQRRIEHPGPDPVFDRMSAGMNVSAISPMLPRPREACAAQTFFDILTQPSPHGSARRWRFPAARRPRRCSRFSRRAVSPGISVQLFWVDERCVPPTDSQSNFKLANDAWLAPAKFPAGNIHRVQTERDPQEAAEIYADGCASSYSAKACRSSM